MKREKIKVRPGVCAKTGWWVKNQGAGRGGGGGGRGHKAIYKREQNKKGRKSRSVSSVHFPVMYKLADAR